jgi:hypothetical protein
MGNIIWLFSGIEWDAGGRSVEDKVEAMRPGSLGLYSCDHGG